MTSLLVRLRRERRAQDLVEYALIAAIIALGVLTTIQGVTTALSAQYTSVADQVGGASSGASSAASSGSSSGGGAAAAVGSENVGSHHGGVNNGNGRGNQ